MGGQLGRTQWRANALRLMVALLCCALLPGLTRIASAQVVKPLLRTASAIAYDRAGNLYIADAGAHQVWEATLGGTLVLVAGNGVQGFGGDGGPAVSAELNQPQGLAFGPDGTMYIADTGNDRVRAVSSAGTITTFAGTGGASFDGDGGKAAAAQLKGPTALAVDGSGALLVCDTGNQRVRRVSEGTISTVAGSGEQGFAGDGGPALAARVDSPGGVVVASDGRVFISDTHNQRVRVINASGVISTIAGTGGRGFGGDGGPAIGAVLSAPRGLGLDGAGDLLIADEGNQRIRKVSSAGTISTVAGSGVEGAGWDGQDVLLAAARAPRGVAVSSFGTPVYADRLNGTVREVTTSAGLFQPAALAPGRASVVTSAATQGMTYGGSGSAALSVLGPVGRPQGQVQLSENGVGMSAAVLTSGTTTVGMNGLSAGPHHLVATYIGDGLNPGSSASFDVAVAAAPLTATASSMQVAYGLPVPQLAGSVSGLLPQDAGAVDVSFNVGDGTAPPVGTYPITATLNGPKAANYLVSMSPSSGSLQVVKAGTSAVLDSVDLSFVGMPLTLSATIAPATSGQPTGTVQFLDGTTVVATASLGGGTATALYSSPPIGLRNLSVQYLGDGNFLPSVSASSGVRVADLPDFTLATSGLSAASTAAGGMASYSVLVGAGPEPFTGAVSLSATGLPSGALVSFSPPQVVPGSGSATVTVAVQTSAAQTAVARGANQRSTATGAGVGLGVLCCLGLCRRRLRRSAFGLLGAVVLLSGCGARQVGEGTGGVLAQTYTFQVAGTATNLAGKVVTHTTTLTLTVQQ